MWARFDGHDREKLTGVITPSEVLYYYDEPLIFVCETQFGPLLVSKFDEEDGADFYLSSFTNVDVVNSLKDGLISLRDSFSQPRCWILEAKNFLVQRSWGRALSEIPEDFLPDKNVGLYHTHGVVKDRITMDNTVPLEPFLSVSFRGGELGESIDFSVLKSLVEESYFSVKKLFSSVLTGLHISEITAGKIISIPVREPKFASLSLEIEKPIIDHTALKNVFSGIFHSEEEVERVAKRFVESVKEMEISTQDTNSPVKIEQRNIEDLEYLVPLLPVENSPFDVLVINGRVLGVNGKPIIINQKSGITLRNSYKLLHEFDRTVEGKLVDLNERSNTIIIKTNYEREVRCTLNQRMMEKVALRFQKGMELFASGRFTKRDRRDLLMVNYIKFQDGSIILRNDEKEAKKHTEKRRVR